MSLFLSRSINYLLRCVKYNSVFAVFLFPPLCTLEGKEKLSWQSQWLKGNFPPPAQILPYPSFKNLPKEKRLFFYRLLLLALFKLFSGQLI